jgi:hypothetical protein
MNLVFIPLQICVEKCITLTLAHSCCEMILRLMIELP